MTSITPRPDSNHLKVDQNSIPVSGKLKKKEKEQVTDRVSRTATKADTSKVHKMDSEQRHKVRASGRSLNIFERFLSWIISFFSTNQTPKHKTSTKAIKHSGIKSGKQESAAEIKEKLINKMKKLSFDQQKQKMQVFSSFLEGVSKNEGVLRLSGNVVEVNDLLENRVITDEFKTSVQDKENIDEMVSAFKNFIASCQIFENKEAYSALLEFGSNKSRTIEDFENVYSKLGENQQVLFNQLLSLLRKIADDSTDNKMDEANIATCIGPNLKSDVSMEEILLVNGAVEFLIKNALKR